MSTSLHASRTPMYLTLQLLPPGIIWKPVNDEDMNPWNYFYTLICKMRLLMENKSKRLIFSPSRFLFNCKWWWKYLKLPRKCGVTWILPLCCFLFKGLVGKKLRSVGKIWKDDIQKGITVNAKGRCLVMNLAMQHNLESDADKFMSTNIGSFSKHWFGN